MKSVAGTLRLDLAQYRELEAFAKFGSDLDKATLAQLTRGERMVEILKQNQYVPMGVGQQIAIIFAASKGHLDNIAVEKIGVFEKALIEHIANSADDILGSITKEGKISKENGKLLEDFIVNFKKGFSA